MRVTHPPASQNPRPICSTSFPPARPLQQAHTHTALQCVWSPSHVGFFAFRIRAGDAWFSSTIGWMSVCFVTDQKPLEFYKPHSYWKLFGPLKTKPTQHVHSTLRRRSALDGHLRTGWKRKVSTTQTGKCQGLSKKEKKEKREKKERALFSGVGSIETGGGDKPFGTLKIAFCVPKHSTHHVRYLRTINVRRNSGHHLSINRRVSRNRKQTDRHRRETIQHNEI